MPRWRRPNDAVQDFVNTINSLIGLVTPVRTRAPGRYDPSPAALRSLELGTGLPVPLRGPDRVSLQARLRYRLNQDADGWWATIVAYQYALLDQREQVIAADHW